MNRELKFRVWNLIDKIFIHNDDIAISSNGDVLSYFDLTLCKDGISRRTFDESLDPEECVIQQFTGLKDKNGKEIFEGDILSHERYLYYGTVIYDMGSFLVSFPSQTGKTIKTFIDLLPSGFEVLGNIFENQDLLEQR